MTSVLRMLYAHGLSAENPAVNASVFPITWLGACQTALVHTHVLSYIQECLNATQLQNTMKLQSSELLYIDLCICGMYI